MTDEPLSALEEEFRGYLREVRSYAPDSMRGHLGTFRRFARFLDAQGVASARCISPDLGYEFLERCVRGKSRRHAKASYQAVRSVLQFLHFSGRHPQDLSRTMTAPCIWRFAHIPKAFSEAEISHMLGHLRAETPYDHRERLVMLLFIVYGLRLGEVTNLSLDDIDLTNKTITVRERKNTVPLVLPLLPVIEEALQGYLAQFRPTGLETSQLFVTIKRRSRAPATWQAIHTVVKKFLVRVGVEGSSIRFRHTLATHLINRGVGLEAIQALLGHRHVDSTRIYAKVHWEALREVAENDSMSL
jgi:site-specific recombinase XerD